MSVTMDKLKKLEEEIKLKAQLEARYYQGALDVLVLLQTPENKVEETEPEPAQPNKRSSSKGPKP